MLRNTYQTGFLSILYSVGSSPLQIWKTCIEDGHVKRITDDPDVELNVLELLSSTIATTFITCPPSPDVELGIKLPFLVIIVKNVSL